MTSPHAHSSSTGSSNSSNGSFEDGIQKDTGLWIVTSGSPTTLSPTTVKAEYEEELNDVHENDHLLGASLDLEPTESRQQHGVNDTRSTKEPPVTWMSLPRKGQLFLLMLARISEPLTQTSLQAYMYYQLKSFDHSLSDATIASQVGIMQGSFTAAQFLTAFLWGKAADSPKVGRKRVLMIGLLGTSLSVCGYGFARNFATAIFFRSLGGLLNGNVGVMRTMISEIVIEKKYAFLRACH